MTFSADPVRRSRSLKGRANKGVSVNQFTIDHPAVSLHTRKRVRNDSADGTPSTSTYSMQDHTEDDEAPGPNCDLDRIVIVSRKAAKRTLPVDLTEEEIHLIKKLRLEKLLPTDEATRKTASPDVSVAFPLPAADGDIDGANADSVTDTQPNAGATGSWTSEEDAKLTSAVANTSKRKIGKEYKIDWVAIAALVPGRTNKWCSNRWHDVLDHSIDRANGRTGKWTEDEDSKLRDAVQRHDGKDWVAMASLVPGRTRNQCRHRWQNILDPSIDRANGRTGMWTAVEDSKLKDAVQTHGTKNWGVICALVPGRTKQQCRARWHRTSVSNADPTTGRTGKWTEDEDSKLKDAVLTHGDKNWKEVAAQVPGRTKKQCYNRCHDVLKPSIALTAGRTGEKW
jgi:hypothetical protein